MELPYSPGAEKRLKTLFNLLGLRIIPGYFLQKNPEKFMQWHYNACNQTAVITAWVLSKLLEVPGKHNSSPFGKNYFTIEIFEGMFTEDNLPGQYNHAYLFATEDKEIKSQVGKEDELSLSFFIDVGRMSNPTVFKMGYGVSDLPVRHSNNYQMHAVKKLPLLDMLYKQPEYFTGKLGIEICADIEKILNKLGFDLRNFDWKA